MLTVIIICGATIILTACKGNSNKSDINEMEEYRKMILTFICFNL